MQDYSLGLIVPAVLTVCEENANGAIMGEGWRRQSRLRLLQMWNSNCVINLEKTKMTYPTSLCFVSCPPSIYFYILLSYAETLLICRANLSLIGRRNSFLQFFLTKNKKTQFICCFPNTMPFVLQDINASLFATFFVGAMEVPRSARAF